MEHPDRVIRAVIFDTDGVVTNTAVVHFEAWKRLFDGFLDALGADGADDEFTDDDYRRYVDGVPRYDGVSRFLESRGIDLPFGGPGDPPGDGTICALGNAKNDHFLDQIERSGVEAFPGTMRFITQLRENGIRTAAISASENCAQMLRSAGVDGLFDARVDGMDAHELGFPGKPDPAIFVIAAERLGVEPGEAAVVEDAIAGVRAGRDGGFGLVIGIDRTGHRDSLTRYADNVVTDLDELRVDDGRIVRAHPGPTTVLALPSALDSGAVLDRMDGRDVAVFLDYDGTLSPIVERPELALMPPESLEALARLTRLCTVGVISGRGLADLSTMIDCRGLWMAGSHGFDIRGPDGRRHDFEGAEEFTPVLDKAVALLNESVGAIAEAWIEPKPFAVAVHYRQTPDAQVPALEAIVASVASELPSLRMVAGKKIFELRPDIDWDKGTALFAVLDAVGIDRHDTVALYLGDDSTDEDAFRAIHDTGLGIVVETEDRETAARFRLSDTDEVRQFLTWLADHLEAKQR